jgi:type I restriction enzyme, S subunit
LSSPLPRGWSKVELGDVSVEIKNGISAKPDGESGTPILRISAVRPMILRADDVRFLGGDPTQWQGYRVHENDLLFTRYNGNRALVGICARVSFEPPQALVYPDKIIRVRVNESIVCPAFLERAVHVGASRAFVDNKTKTSAGQIGISGGDLRQVPFPLPPLNEQRRIVAKLEALQARSRRAREALETVPPLLEKLRQSILAAAFRGDLTKDWRAQHPNVEPASELLKRIRVERRRKWEEAELAKMKAKGKAPADDRWKARYKEPEAVDAKGLPELPGGWCWASLDELTLLVGGITKGQKRKSAAQLRMIPYLRVANVQRGHLDLVEVKTIEATEEEIAELSLVNGDILLNEGGDRDKLGRGWIWNGELPECIHQNHVFRARCASAHIEPKYVSHYANLRGQDFFVDQGKQTTNLASVSISRVRRFPIALPPAAEQRLIVQLVSNRLATATDTTSIIKTAEQKVVELERALLAKAFRGELVPQDPNDEPAEAMLARLRAEKGAAPEKRAAARGGRVARTGASRSGGR